MISKNELSTLFEQLEIEKEAEQVIFDVLFEIEKNSEARQIFLPLYNRYKNEHKLDYKNLTDEVLPRMSELVSVHRYKLNMAVLFSILPYSIYFYNEESVTFEIWKNSVLDFKWKMLDCYDINGFFGIRTASLPWFERWFFGKRFAFHRLQFETNNSYIDYKSENFDIKKGDLYVSVHIPSSRGGVKFDKKNRDISYAMAKAYYAPQFKDGQVLFSCDSWLLAPYHSEILPESSNIRQFKEEFEIAETGPVSWHLPMIFNTEDLSNPEKLPENSAIQKHYKKLLIEKRDILGAHGFRFFKSGE